MTNGFILIGRKILESNIWSKPPLYLKVWMFLLCNAQYQTYKNLERGQLITSIPEIQETCTYYAGYRKEKPSKKQIADILEYLRNPRDGINGRNANDPMIVTAKVTHGMLVTICNFNDYQDAKFYERNNERSDESTTKVARRYRQGTNIKEEDIKRKIPPDLFVEFSFSPELESKINDWLTYKTERKEAYKPTGLKTLLKKIKEKTDQYGDHAIINLIDDCMASNWKGLIWDKLPEKPKSNLQEVKITW